MPGRDDTGGIFERYSEGWDYSVHDQRVFPAWSTARAHGEGHRSDKTSRLIGSKGSTDLFSSRLLALRAMRYETERQAAERLLAIDRKIAAETIEIRE